MKRTYPNERVAGATGAVRRNDSTSQQQQQSHQNMYSAPQTALNYNLNPSIPPPYYRTPPPQSQMEMMSYMNQGANYMFPGGPHQPAVPWNFSSPPPPLPTDDNKRSLPPLPPGHPPKHLASSNHTVGSNHSAGPIHSAGPNQHAPGMRGRGMNRYRGDNRGGIRRPPQFGPNRQTVTNYPGKIQTKKQPNETGFPSSIDMSSHSFDENHIQVNKKSKRKPMSTRYTRAKEWDRDDAIKALALEREYNKLQKTPMLILKFPDPELNKHIVKQYSTFIETVHFQQPSTPRYCFVQLKEGADIDAVSEELSKIPFGTGTIIAEKKHQGAEESQPVGPEEIDPYTLYIGNLPTQVSVKVVKEHFPTAQRIDIGYAQRMKYTRYAFIRYNSVEESMAAYRKTFNQLIESRSLIVRFRRQKGNIGLPGETKTPNPRKEAPTKKLKDLLSIEDPDLAQEQEDNTDLDSEIDTSSLISTSDKSSGGAEPSVGKTELDSKVNVLQDARRMMQKRSLLSGTTHTSTMGDLDFGLHKVKNEPHETRPFEDDRDNNINLLGTRIKDEPLDDDALLAQAHCYDDELEDDDLGFEPEEEDDEIVMDRYNNYPILEAYKPKEWTNFHTGPSEYYPKETKPNINKIMPKLSTNDFLFPEAKKTKVSDKKRDEMDDLFDSLNPEDDYDSDIGF